MFYARRLSIRFRCYLLEAVKSGGISGGITNPRRKYTPMSLSNLACKDAKVSGKPLKLADSGGLFLHVMPNGSKYWRQKYRFGGKEKLLSLGVSHHLAGCVLLDPLAR